MNRRLALAGIALAALAGMGIAYWMTAAGVELPAPLVSGERATPTGQKPLLTEFGDFQCPHCARFATQVIPLIRKELVEKGHADFEYRHYPFLGPMSFNAAEAAECAREQDAFDEYHDGLYGKLAKGRNVTNTMLEETAGQVGIDAARFQECRASGRTRARVLADLEYGRALGVRGTPTLVLDGELLEWNVPGDIVDLVKKAATE